MDIGKSDSHGGLSNGAIGFDAFYPKRDEKNIKKIGNMNKINIIDCTLRRMVVITIIGTFQIILLMNI